MWRPQIANPPWSLFLPRLLARSSLRFSYGKRPRDRVTSPNPIQTHQHSQLPAPSRRSALILPIPWDHSNSHPCRLTYLLVDNENYIHTKHFTRFFHAKQTQNDNSREFQHSGKAFITCPILHEQLSAHCLLRGDPGWNLCSGALHSHSAIGDSRHY